MANANSRMLTANRLSDGGVVYLADGGRWVEQFALGAVWAGDEEAKRAVETGDIAVSEQIVIGPYLIDVHQTDSGPEPTSVRERIRRDRGPTVPADAGSWTGRIPG